MSNFNNHGSFNNPRNDGYSKVDYYNERGPEDVVGIGTWVLILIATGIPFVNFIVLLILAFGVENENLKNYGKAALIILGIGLLLAFMLRGCVSIF